MRKWLRARRTGRGQHVLPSVPTPPPAPPKREPGVVLHVHVDVPSSADKARIGRQIVEAIREYEKRSGGRQW